MPVHQVRVDDVEAQLREHWSDHTAQQLFAFGVLMVEEVRDRTDALDAKGLTIVGWASALIAFLLTQIDVSHAAWSRVATLVPAGCAVYALWMAYSGTRLRDWDWPSEQDWFRTALFDKPATLQHYHLMSLLETHQHMDDRNAQKAAALAAAQGALVFGALAAALLLVARVVVSPWVG